MAITTIKIKKSTKSALNEFRYKSHSYDEAIRKLISNIKNKNLKNELIRGYKEAAKENIKILEEWENASRELD